MSDSVTSWTVARQAPLSVGFSRRGLLLPPPGDLPNPGIEPRSLALQTDSIGSEPQWKPTGPPGKSPIYIFLIELYLISDGGLVLKFRRQILITCQRKVFSLLTHHITICLLEGYLLKDKKSINCQLFNGNNMIEIIVQALLGALQ